MTTSIYQDLAWLPAAPSDFSARCKLLQTTAGPVGRALRVLANHALNENQLARLARVIASRQRDPDDLAPLSPFRLGILSNSTTDFMVAPLISTAARHGLSLSCFETPFGQLMQAALDGESGLYRARPDAVLIALDLRGLPLSAALGDAAAAHEAGQAAMSQLDTIRQAVHAHAGIPCIVQTLARPVESTFGNLDLAMPGTERYQVDLFNRLLAASLPGSEDVLLDIAGLAETVGLADWHDPGLWNLGKIPFANTFLPLYADVVCRLLAALRGKSRRCLILDLDNTLWGGVIGDDGLEGILIGQGDAVGEAFQSVQRTALALRGRGIVLAVSSKNQDSTARMPFQKHPEMLLREKHIAVFQANWNDKATNIKAIAEELALGLESMVFLDDNPAERGLVREILPEVAIPELPADPSLYARTLLASGYFESITFSTEDRQRAEFYQDNSRRLALKQQAGDVEGYLRSLEMTIHFAPFDATGRARIAQLINKSNQFNLTTRRYTEADVGQMELDPEVIALQVRLRDIFGDNGMISVIIGRVYDKRLDLDTWLMSCRVLGRGVERCVLNELVQLAETRGLLEITGSYIPTERNELVKDHYAKLGFQLVKESSDGRTDWRLKVEDYQPVMLPMVIERVTLQSV